LKGKKTEKGGDVFVDAKRTDGIKCGSRSERKKFRIGGEGGLTVVMTSQGGSIQECNQRGYQKEKLRRVSLGNHRSREGCAGGGGIKGGTLISELEGGNESVYIGKKLGNDRQKELGRKDIKESDINWEGWSK